MLAKKKLVFSGNQKCQDMNSEYYIFLGHWSNNVYTIYMFHDVWTKKQLTADPNSLGMTQTDERRHKVTRIVT